MVLSKRAKYMFDACQNILYRHKLLYPRLKDYKLTVTHRNKYLGLTKFLSKCILLNYNLLDLGSEKQIISTIFHEMAHALDLTQYNYNKKRGGYHGNTWKTWMKLFNFPCDHGGDFYNYNSLQIKDYGIKTKYKLRYLNACLK